MYEGRDYEYETSCQIIQEAEGWPDVIVAEAGVPVEIIEEDVFFGVPGLRVKGKTTNGSIEKFWVKEDEVRRQANAGQRQEAEDA